VRGGGQKTTIKEWRKHRGLTLVELGKKAGISGAMVSQLERGSSGYRQETLEKVAGALQVKPWQLLGFKPGEVGTATLMAKLQDIEDRLGRMEQMLAGREERP
jgi:transcriptional regulator with XRE-family HTH domain